jgi:hypothetical protein
MFLHIVQGGYMEYPPKPRKGEFHIVSEPGDGTKYDYQVTRMVNGWKVEAVGSTFTFPAYIHNYDLNHLAEQKPHRWIKREFAERIIERATEYNSNPFTVAEVCRTLLILRGLYG